MKNKNLYSLQILALFIATLLISSCAYEVNMSQVKVQQLSFPHNNDYDALVNSHAGIRAIVDEDVSFLVGLEDNPTLTQFSLPNDTTCYRTVYSAYEALPDGDLQIWKRCESGGGSVRTYLLAYDWETNQLEELAGILPLGSSGASWNPEQTKAIGYLDSGFASRTLFWISKDGFSALDLVVGDKNHSWNLQNDFPEFKTIDTGESGTTGRVAWSRDGKQIAFFASPDAIGKTGFSRFDVKYGLYLMDPTTLNPISVDENIYSPFVLAWSSDSRHIAFIGKYGFWKEYGIWVYSLDTDTITRVSSGTYQSIVWRPGKNVLVAIECDENYDSCNKIMEYDLTNVLETRE